MAVPFLIDLLDDLLGDFAFDGRVFGDLISFIFFKRVLLHLVYCVIVLVLFGHDCYLSPLSVSVSISVLIGITCVCGVSVARFFGSVTNRKPFRYVALIASRFSRIPLGRPTARSNGPT